jgi:hypothetical protein
VRFDDPQWTPVGPSSALSSIVTHGLLAVHDDGSGRALYQVGVVANEFRLLRWTGDDWLPLGATFGAGVGPSLSDLQVLDDGVHGPQIHAGGAFTSIGGFSMNRVARWDGNAWQPLGGGVSLVNTSPAEVRALAEYDSGSGPRIIVAGKFDLAGGVPCNRIAAWDGAVYTPLGTGMDGNVNTLCAFDDGSGPKLYVGGEFSHAGGVPARWIARWDGSTWSALNGEPNFPVSHLHVHDDGSGPKLYVAGGFTDVAGFR